MHRVHFIAIGGAAMHNLAIAVSKKKNYLVTGSDDEIYDPSYSRLQNCNLLPHALGWFPDKISKDLFAVIVSIHVKADNPELLRAKELGLKIYSYPEFLFLQTRNKTRIVVAGSQGKTTICTMIIHVLKQLRMDADYVIGAQIEGFQNSVKLSHDSRIAVIEGDEYFNSPIDSKPKFHYYKPHIAVISGVSWKPTDAFPSEEKYVEQFKIFIDRMEVQGRLVYCEKDVHLAPMIEKLRRDIVPFSYATPTHKIIEGIWYIKHKKAEIPLKLYGEHNLKNINAARLACRQVGVTDDQFFEAIRNYEGVTSRLQTVFSNQSSLVIRDIAHIASQITASIDAVKLQYPDKTVIACLELETLDEELLNHYQGSLNDADVAVLYFNPDNNAANDRETRANDEIKIRIRNDAHVCFNIDALINKCKELNNGNVVLLLMSSAGFSKMNLDQFCQQVFEC